jgi:hypothetical protein
MRSRSCIIAATLAAATLLLAQNPGNGKTSRRADRLIGVAGPAGSSSSAGPFLLIYNGGPVILGQTHIYYIWYGNWSVDPNAAPILNTFANNLTGSLYYNILTQYSQTPGGNISNSVVLSGSTNSTYVTANPLALTDSDISGIVQAAIGNNSLPLDVNGVYFVLTAPGVAETSGFLSTYCGWHNAFLLSDTWIQYAFVGDAAGPNLHKCAGQSSSSPNNDPSVDAMASLIAHELSEAVTDPLNNAWFDAGNQEIADKCIFNFGTTFTAPNGSMANVTLGGFDYLIQQLFSNASDSCVMSYQSTPDYSLSVSPGSQSAVQGGTTGNYTVTVNPTNGFSNGVTLSVTGLPAGATLNAPAPNPTSTTATFSISAGTAATGTYPLTITGTSGALIHTAGATFVVSQGGCTYVLNASGQAFPPVGGLATINVTATQGCAWSVLGAPNWLTFTSSTSGSGNGTLSYQVTANNGVARSATIKVAGFSFTIEQEAATIPGLNFIGSMAHVAAEENWTTTFTLVNKGASSTTARLSLFGDAVDPSGNGPLTLPLAFPQQPLAADPLLAASFDQTLAANASLIVTSAGSQTPPVLVGSAQLSATGAVDGFAIFHQIVTTQEAVVPMETRNANSYLLAFDNTNGLVLGVAVENLSAQNAIIPVVIRDDTGAVIGTPGASISLGGNGHMSFVLSDPTLGFPITANKRGTIEFDTPAGGQISVLGIRFSPPNNALTTIPALANVGTGGGSIAHLASGGDGWETTFVLVNTGTSAAQAILSFFADMTGAPMPLPLSFPQGNVTATTASSVTQTLAAGASLLVQSSGAPQLLTGSAQLSTTGNVSGFVIFRHNGQEAVVPLESRNAGAYLLAFDNTNGTATGVAVNAVSAQQVNIPVTVRDDTGATIATDTITLNPNGHYAFTLVTDRYAGTNNMRGTIEFDTPVGAQIGALGIRIPTGAAHTYTTLPALAK